MRTAIVALAACLLAGPAAAQAGLCIDKASQAKLADSLGFHLSAEATAKDQRGSIAVYVYTSEAGSWQIFYSRDGMMMCMLVGGEDWSLVPMPPKGDPA